MNCKKDLFLGFAGSLLLHGLVLLCVACTWFQSNTLLIPNFQTGESSLALTLVSYPIQPVEQVVFKRELLPPVYTDPAPDDHKLVLADTQPDTLERSVEIEKTLRAHKQGSLAPEKVMYHDADMLTKGIIAKPRSRSQIRPYYPLGSRMRGEGGTVILRTTVDVFGKAQRIEVTKSSGYHALNRAAINAMQRAQFIPAQQNGMPREAQITFTFHFQLSD